MDSDPFFGVKDEVFKALNKTRGLYLRWRELSDTNGSTAEIEWTTTELRNSLRSIEWDLEDLEDTIAIVEKNPNKFKIDNRELASRRNFINATRDEVKSMKEKMSMNRRTIDQDITARQPLLDSPTKATTVIGGGSNGVTLPTSTNSNKLHHSLISQAGAVMAARHSSAKYSKLENQMDSPSHYAMGGSTPSGGGGGGGGSGTGFDSPSNRFLGETMSTQQRMMSAQDEQLDIISDSIGTLKTVSRQIGGELDEQAVMLDDFGNELENTDSKLDSTMKKVAKVLHMTNDSRQWTAIIILSVTLLIIIILFIIL